jgi:hypothetical protein
MVGKIVVPDEFKEIINKTKHAMIELSKKLDPAAYKEYHVFIDPIDGTREFASGKGEQCTILVGFSDKAGRSCAGMCYRPIPNPATWAGGCADENFCIARLDKQAVPKMNGLLTSNGSISPFISSLMSELKFDRVPSGGVGNKLLMLMEGKATAYIQDRGVSRWDTCAAEAVFAANKGKLTKLLPLITEGKHDERYTYKVTATNLDFVPNTANLGAYNFNAKPGQKLEKRLAKTVDEVKPYSNLAGLFAISGHGEDTAKLEETILASLLTADSKTPASYD